jgi:Lon protease-like protein
VSERCGDCLLSRARLPQASLGCKGAVTSFAPSADGRLIASASTDGSVRVSTLIVKVPFGNIINSRRDSPIGAHRKNSAGDVSDVLRMAPNRWSLYRCS